MLISHAFMTSLNFGSDTIAVGPQNYDFIFLLKTCRVRLPLTGSKLQTAD